MFVFGTIGNSLVSIAALRQHRSMENKIGRTNVHMMVLHLTIAGTKNKKNNINKLKNMN